MHILENKFLFNDKKGSIYYILPLNKDMAKKQSEEILKLINIIPFIKWNKKDLLKDYNEYYSKWNFSLIVVNKKNKIIGILIAYFRLSDEKHIFDSLYIHKLAIKPEFQYLGIGSFLLDFFIFFSFKKIKWLNNISVQTNFNLENRKVIKFYQKFNFEKQYYVKYPNKTDILLLLTKENYKTQNFKNLTVKSDNYLFKHPRINQLENDSSPIIYFSSSNEMKKKYYKYIFSNYNINLKFINTKLPLIEPQIDPDLDEATLVSYPLKLFSRFINKVPFIVEDTILFIEFFNKDFTNPSLPGHDTKNWWNQIGAQGILDIMNSTNKRNAIFVAQIGAYIDKGHYIFSKGKIEGRISKKISVNKKLINNPGTYPFFFHTIFIPNGSNKTLAEMDAFELSKFDYKRKCVIDFIEKLKKYYYFKNSQLNLFEDVF